MLIDFSKDDIAKDILELDVEKLDFDFSNINNHLEDIFLNSEFFKYENQYYTLDSNDDIRKLSINEEFKFENLKVFLRRNIIPLILDRDKYIEFKNVCKTYISYDVINKDLLLFSFIQEIINYYGENRVEVENIGISFYNVTIHYPKITITNSLDESHEIKDLYLRFSLVKGSNDDLYIQEIKGVRTTLTTNELYHGYYHSHLNNSDLDKFCLGSGVNTIFHQIDNTLKSEIDLKSKVFSVCSMFDDFVSWESLEGKPYKYIGHLKNFVHISDVARLTHDEISYNDLINKVFQKVIIPNIRKFIDVFDFETLSFTDSKVFEKLLIKEIYHSNFEDVKSVLCFNDKAYPIYKKHELKTESNLDYGKLQGFKNKKIRFKGNEIKYNLISDVNQNEEVTPLDFREYFIEFPNRYENLTKNLILKITCE